ncbi:MAG: hypothetical protein KC713_00750 [Candidatus Omnitrophica bacterium]|nr:hypothetical protein [Candidatus Omnitrophota bacterium]
MNPSSKFKSYINVFFILCSAFMAIVALLNFHVDPYNELGRNTIGIYFSTERQDKSNIEHIDHDALIIGSSRVANIDAGDLRYYQFYNASFASALPEEISAFLAAHAHHQKLVLIGIDFYMFNEFAFEWQEIDQWEQNQFPWYEYLLSLRVFKDSLNALRYARMKKDTPVSARRQEPTAPTLKQDFHPEKFISWIELFQNRNYNHYQLSTRRIEKIVQTYRLLESRGIKTMIFINPLHPQIKNLIINTPLKKTYHQWILSLQKEIPRLYNLSDPVWGFGQTTQYKINDPSHYTAQTGAAFINIILEKEKDQGLSTGTGN